MTTHALLVVDVQESFRQRETWQVVSRPDIADQVGRLVAAFRDRGDRVIWILHSEPDTGTVFDPTLGFVRPIDGLVPAAGEPVLIKTVHNAFTSTNLQHLLTVAGVSDVTVCGLRTEQCVETTSRVASDLGYGVTFVTDATATFPIPHWDAPQDRGLAEILADPLTLSSADIVSRTEYALAGRFADIRTVAEITG